MYGSLCEHKDLSSDRQQLHEKLDMASVHVTPGLGGQGGERKVIGAGLLATNLAENQQAPGLERDPVSKQ